MNKILIFIACLIFNLAVQAIEDNCVYNYLPKDKINLNIIERVNLSVFPNLVRDAILHGEIKVFNINNDPAVQFIHSYIQPGDKILLNKEEIFELTVIESNNEKGKFANLLYSLTHKNVKKKFHPFVGIRQDDRAKYYGFIAIEQLDKLTADLISQPLSKDALLNYSKNNKLTILYALCPKNRQGLCAITIKHHGKWLLDANKKMKKFSAIALSVREYFDSNKSLRILPTSDTPQGIYGLWGSMFSSKQYFGGVPRIDIDLNSIPLNGHAYNIFSYLLEDIIPNAALEDYWLNELPLAYAMGRSLFRLHANAVENVKPSDYAAIDSNLKYLPSQGCIVLGEAMAEFFNTLVKLGIFVDRYSKLDYKYDGPTQWHAAKNLGKAFIIIKDVD